MSVSAERVTTTPTFLFTDIEGSTRLLGQLGDAYADVLETHRRLIGAAVADAGGHVFGSEGDALFAAFPTPGGALAAAVAAQRALDVREWPDGVQLRVRMGIHTGEALRSTGGDYVGMALHQVARITAAGHGGQVLVSEATRRLLGAPPVGVALRDLGERRLKDLAVPERLHQLVAKGLAERFPPLRTLDAAAHNLPVQLTSFVGRAELAAARDALADTRLLTLTGPGGTGKTRLALQLGAEVSDEFGDGVYFVPLDAVTDVRLVASAIASTLGLTVSGSTAPLDAVIGHVRERRMLLILDNFEQVVDAAGDVARLLREAPEIKVIVTTRVVLRIYGEREFQVPPLGLPPESARPHGAAEAMRHEAVQLFVERAVAAQPAFVLTDDNAPVVIDICRRLDGLPLAIELAAARTRALSIAAIHARLDQHLNLLTGGARDLPGRQRTLRGAIDWSYDLLAEPDRRLFERFSIHAGGAFLSQADAVCGPSTELGEDVLDGLSSLADKSLVRPDIGVDEDPRFAMLVTIRDYAHERLSARPEFHELARRHADVYLELVETLAPDLTSPQGRRLSDRLEQDHDNLRAALDWAIATGEVEYALRFISAIWRFWQVRGHLDEARRRVDAVMAMPGVDSQPPEIVARAYGAAGSITYWQADVPATHRYYRRALDEARRTDDDRLLAEALYNFGFAAADQEATNNALYAAGEEHWMQSLEIYRRLGDDRGIADASWGVAMARAARGDRSAAIAFGTEALEGYRRIGDPFRIGWGHYLLAGLRVPEGDLDAADAHLRQSLETFRAVNDRAGILLNLAGFLLLAQRRNQSTRANRLGGAVETLRAATGAALIDAPIELVDFVIPNRPTDDREALADWDDGARMSAEEAAAYALSDADASDPTPS